MNTRTTPLQEHEMALFVGRRKEKGHILTLIENGLNCAVSGNPGVGKTTFLNAISHEMKAKYPVVRISMPVVDTAYFYKKILYGLTELIPGGEEEIREKLAYTQEVETLIRFLFKGETLSSLEEEQMLSLLGTLLKRQELWRHRLFSLEEMRKASVKLIEALGKKVVFLVDDLDKALGDDVPKGTVPERLLAFFLENYEVLNAGKGVWAFSLSREFYEDMQGLLNAETKKSLLAMVNDIIPLPAFTEEEFRELLYSRLDGRPEEMFAEDALRLLFGLAKGNPRTLMFLLTRSLRAALDQESGRISAGEILSLMSDALALDEKSLAILRRASEDPYVIAGDNRLKEATALDTVSLSMRMADLASKRLLVPDYIDKQKVYRLPYIHGGSITEGGKREK
ncbi:ATP-binding protein [Candidatus Mcinerneyibacteriota bacterium]|nr:ATP-binding protein [Candidatus Mcinerneyibacteriota bacterium]